MQRLSANNLLEALEWRNATKKFDSTKKINDETWAALEKTLILTPSSFGAMPYKFVVVKSQEMKDALMKVSWNQTQVSECSHHVVFLAKEKMDADYVRKYIKHIAEIRGQKVSELEGFEKMMVSYLVDKMSPEQSFEWATKQVYIALGNFMTAAAVLGVDACPLEGIQPAQYDEVLGLVGSGFKSVCACPVGYRASDDKYADLKKVRFDAKDLILYK